MSRGQPSQAVAHAIVEVGSQNLQTGQPRRCEFGQMGFCLLDGGVGPAGQAAITPGDFDGLDKRQTELGDVGVAITEPAPKGLSKVSCMAAFNQGLGQMQSRHRTLSEVRVHGRCREVCEIERGACGVISSGSLLALASTELLEDGGNIPGKVDQQVKFLALVDAGDLGSTEHLNDSVTETVFTDKGLGCQVVVGEGD